MRTTWTEAWEYIWESFTGVRREGIARRGRAAALLLLVLGIAWVLWGDLAVQKSEAPAPSPPSQAEAGLAQALLRDARLAAVERTASGEWARSTRGRKFDVFEAPEPAAALAPAEVPDITLKAIMALGRDRVAVADIPGVGSGLILRAGDSFLGGRGKILRVTDGGLILRWDNADIVLEF